MTEEGCKRRRISFLSELVPAEGPGEGSTANNTGSGTSDDDITVSSEDLVNTMKAPQSSPG